MPRWQDLTALHKHERAIKSTNAAGLPDLKRQGRRLGTPNGTRGSVLSLKNCTHVGNRHADEVRGLAGPFKDRTAWASAATATTGRMFREINAYVEKTPR